MGSSLTLPTLSTLFCGGWGMLEGALGERRLTAEPSAQFLSEFARAHKARVMVVWSLSRSEALHLHERRLDGLLCPWDFPGKNTRVGCHFLLQGIFPTLESNPGLLHCRCMYQLSLQGSPKAWETLPFLSHHGVLSSCGVLKFPVT